MISRFRCVPQLLVPGLLIACASLGCSLLKRGETRSAKAVAHGARIVAVNTARAGALISKLIATGTYYGSKRAVTWTSARTVDGTAATLDMLGLIERPVPPDVLESIPDELLESLTSLEFIPAQSRAGITVISSSDLRWEGELFYRLNRGQSIDVRIDGPVELIVVTMACFPPPEQRLRPKENNALYKVSVREDDESLGDVRFETGPSDVLGIYGEQGWRASEPGVFVVKVVEGNHLYHFNIQREGLDRPMLVSFFLPRYGTRDKQESGVPQG
jgi:hypothetical protein